MQELLYVILSLIVTIFGLLVLIFKILPEDSKERFYDKIYGRIIIKCALCDYGSYINVPGGGIITSIEFAASKELKRLNSMKDPSRYEESIQLHFVNTYHTSVKLNDLRLIYTDYPKKVKYGGTQFKIPLPVDTIPQIEKFDAIEPHHQLSVLVPITQFEDELHEKGPVYFEVEHSKGKSRSNIFSIGHIVLFHDLLFRNYLYENARLTAFQILKSPENANDIFETAEKTFRKNPDFFKYLSKEFENTIEKKQFPRDLDSLYHQAKKLASYKYIKHTKIDSNIEKNNSTK